MPVDVIPLEGPPPFLSQEVVQVGGGGRRGVRSQGLEGGHQGWRGQLVGMHGGSEGLVKR